MSKNFDPNCDCYECERLALEAIWEGIDPTVPAYIEYNDLDPIIDDGSADDYYDMSEQFFGYYG